VPATPRPIIAPRTSDFAPLLSLLHQIVGSSASLSMQRKEGAKRFQAGLLSTTVEDQASLSQDGQAVCHAESHREIVRGQNDGCPPIFDAMRNSSNGLVARANHSLLLNHLKQETDAARTCPCLSWIPEVKEVTARQGVRGAA
jgi:hypothetical protein